MVVSSNGSILMLLENNGYPSDPRVRMEALALVDAGFKVTVIAPNEGSQKSYELMDGVSVYRYRAPYEHDSVLGFAWEFIYSTAAAFFMALKVWRREGFQAIHAHSPPDTLFVVGAFFKLFGKKFVFDHHDLSPELYQARLGGEGGSSMLHGLLLLLERMTFYTADFVIATNESYRKIAMTRGKVPHKLTEVVRNGPSLESMGNDEPYEHLVALDKTILGYVGKISLQDGLEYLVDAVYHIKHTFNRTDVLCIIIGDGDDLDRIKGLVAEKKLEDLFLFTGWLEREELGKYLASIDIGVDPDPANPFNDKCTMIKMTEYMVYSKPIVAFDLTEHRFTAGDAAIYIGENDAEQFGQAIVGLMDDKERQFEMGRMARKRVETSIAWEFSVPRLVNVYRKLFGLPGKVTVDKSALVNRQLVEEHEK